MNNINDSLLISLAIEPNHSERMTIAVSLNKLGFLKSRLIRHLLGISLDRLNEQIISSIQQNPNTREDLSQAFDDLMSKKWKVNLTIAKEKTDKVIKAIASIEPSSALELKDLKVSEQEEEFINEDKSLIKVAKIDKTIPIFDLRALAAPLNNLRPLRNQVIRFILGVNLDRLTERTLSSIMQNPHTQEGLSQALNGLMNKRWRVSPPIAKERKVLAIKPNEQSNTLSLKDPQFREKIEKLNKEIKGTIKITEFDEEVPVFVLKEILEDSNTSFSQLIDDSYTFNLGLQDNKQQPVTQSFTCKGWMWKFLTLKSDYFKNIENNPNFKEYKNKTLIIEGYSLEEFNLFLNVLLQKETITEDNLSTLSELSNYFQCQELKAQCQSKIDSFLKEASLQDLKVYLDDNAYLFMHENCKKHFKTILEEIAKKDFKKFKEALSLYAAKSEQEFDPTKLNFNFDFSIKPSNFIINEDLAYLLVNFPNIQHLNLAYCNSITDEEIKSLTSLTNLRYLDLSGCENITDESLEHLANLPLQHLNLSNCENITDESLEYLANLPLQHLNLSNCKNITDESLEHLANLPLQHLNLSNCKNITDESLEHLANLPLQHLNLSGCKNITGKGFKYLANLPLQHLDLSNCKNITDKSLEHLANLPLQHLNLSGCENITGKGFKYLANLPLQHLNLSLCSQITDEGIKCFANLLNLQYLNLSLCSQVTDEGIKCFANLLNLEYLSLFHCSQVTNEGIKCFANLLNLEYLNLFRCSQVTNEGISFLKHLTNCRISI